MSTTRHLATAALAALLLGAAVVACSDGSHIDVGGPPASPDQLEGRTFVATSVVEDGRPSELVRGTQVTLAFTLGHLQASAGCNQFSSEVTFDGDQVVVPVMGGTEMACNGGRQEQDEWLVAVLTSRPSWRLDGNSLAITSDSTVIELLDDEASPIVTTLVGPTWTLDTIIDGETASSVPGVDATLTFGDDGTVVGRGTCNGYGGTFDATASAITFAPGPTTLIGCPGAQATVEAAVSVTLHGRTTYVIDRRQLTITSADGSRGLVYRTNG